MAELGEHAERHHREIAELAAELGIEVIAVGELARAYGADAWVPDAAAALEAARAACQARRRRARQGVALRCARRHRPGPGERHRVMVRVFIAGLIAMVVSVVIGPKFIEFLRRNELGQPIREEGPAGHVVKQGTPVMGGLLILLCALLPVPRALQVHAARADRALPDRLLRRDRLPRRLHQASPPPLARAPGPVEAPPARGDHGRRRVRRPRAEPARHLDLRPGRRTSTSRSRTPTTRSSSSSSRARRTART